MRAGDSEPRHLAEALGVVLPEDVEDAELGQVQVRVAAAEPRHVPDRVHRARPRVQGSTTSLPAAHNSITSI